MTDNFGNSEISFACNGKCRICPYPGANCKTISLFPVQTEREIVTDEIRIDPEVEDRWLKELSIR